MLLGITLILMAIGTAIMLNLYSIFFPFKQNLGDIANYNIAYYGAISSVERAELALRYRQPGFEGKSGWTGTNFGNNTDFTGNIKNSFGWLASGSNSMFWEIKGRKTGLIPGTGQGNVDPELQFTGIDFPSKNFDKLEYGDILEFNLNYDSGSITNAYTGINQSDITTGTDTISKVIFRLPPKISNGTELTNNIIYVNWTLNGYYNGQKFTIFPILHETGGTIGKYDDNIRGDQINNLYDSSVDGFYFSDGTSIHNTCDNFDYFNVVPSTLRPRFSGGTENDTFPKIFTNPNITGVKLSFSIANLLENTTSNGHIFPFLEYSLTLKNGASNGTISDRYFHIKGESQVGNYNVSIQYRKPIKKQTNTDVYIGF